uniref:Protein kinase domain-containing protein n=3 Tax=Magallana gigas TaxID=29159 RepID=A0A8W8LQC5_MAGGI|nr:uncharacterized protein LOC105333658 isoform X2 [Crassostrea gigas]
MSSESFVSKSHRVICEEDILGIPDLVTAREYMKSWGVKKKGIRNTEDAIQVLVEHWREKEKQSKELVKKEISNEFQQAILDDHRKREKLVIKIDETLGFYQRLPRQQKNDLERFITDLVHKCEVKKHELMSPECTILVAGETGAGKSSFINLLLETNLLPTSQLACTSTFCELHKSRDNRKVATLYYKALEGPGSERSPVKIDIGTEERLKQLAVEISRIDENTDESPYERIVIQYPFPLLEKGIVLVDTPGIGESKTLVKHVSRYLEKSFGFIYVVNSSNAGGVHEGRLKDFLRTVISNAEEELYHDSTLFICNKWETVPDKYKEEVRIDTMRKLQKFFSNITEDQLFFMSVGEAQRHYDTLGKMSPEHHAMLSGIQRLLPASLENKLNIHYRFLSQILKRSIYSLKVAQNMAKCSKEEKEKLIMDIKSRMQTIQCKAMRSVDDLRRGMEYETNSLYDTLRKVVNTPEFRRACGHWEPRECPGSKDTKKLIGDASELIENRVCMNVDSWEKKFQVKKTLKEKIISKLKRDCELMEDQIREIESTLIAGENVIIRDLHATMKGDPRGKKMKNKKKGKDDKSSDMNVRSLGGAVSITGRFDSNKATKKFFKDFKKKAPEISMAEATDLYIQNIVNSKDLLKNIGNFLNRYIKGIDLVARKIPDFISSDENMLIEMQKQLQESAENMLEVPKMIRECTMIQGDLDMIYVNDIMRKDYRLRDLEWSDRTKLGSGAFAEVYAAKLRQGDRSVDVALKWFKDRIKPSTVTDILLEDRTMREMKHRNLIRYYGCTLQVKSSNLHWIMILEYCKCTLRDKVIHEDYQNPGKVDHSLQQTPKLEMARYASQICQGLEFLHGKDLVHRDLKLENILLTSEDLIKLTDVGLSKPQTDISGTLAGSPVYMAPEVHLQRGIYNRKADIFSLGIMLWEMWYGEDAADHISSVLSAKGISARNLGIEYEDGLRPKMYDRYRPDLEWSNLIVQCWALEAKQRPEARHVRRFFDDFLRVNRPMK